MGAGLRRRIGLEEASWLVTGSTTTEPELLRFFAALGMPICENWGMSENCGVGTLNDPGRAADRQCRPGRCRERS